MIADREAAQALWRFCQVIRFGAFVAFFVVAFVDQYAKPTKPLLRQPFRAGFGHRLSAVGFRISFGLRPSALGIRMRPSCVAGSHWRASFPYPSRIASGIEV